MIESNVVALPTAATAPVPVPSRHAGLPHSGAVSLLIDCDDCAHQQSTHCADCVVTHVIECDAGSGGAVVDAVVIGVDELAALSRLRRAGLVPGLRHRRQSVEAG